MKTKKKSSWSKSEKAAYYTALKDMGKEGIKPLVSLKAKDNYYE